MISELDGAVLEAVPERDVADRRGFARSNFGRFTGTIHR